VTDIAAVEAARLGDLRRDRGVDNWTEGARY
jgi:hypothetical protein